MKRLVGALAVAVLLLAGCSSGARHDTVHDGRYAPCVTTGARVTNHLAAYQERCTATTTPEAGPTTNSPTPTPTPTDDTTSVPDVPEVLAPSTATTIYTPDDGTFDLTVGRPLAIATQSGLTNRWLGIPVKIANVTGKVNVSEGNFGLSPVRYGDTGKFTTGVTDDLGAPQHAACRGVKPLSHIAPTSSDSGIGYDIGPGTKGTYCLVFLYDATDHPTTISYFADGLIDKSTPSDATWRLGAKPKLAAPGPTGITYTVTSDGGINNVTYSTGGGSQQQDTDVSGNTWTKNIPGGVDIPILLAQNAGGGTISCTITDKDSGEQVDHQTSHGQYAVVSCSGS